MNKNIRQTLGSLAAIALAIVVCATITYAGTDRRLYSMDVIGVGTNSKAYTIHGSIEAIKVDCPPASTGTVTVTSDELTLLTATSVSSDTTYFPRATAHDTAGAAIDTDPAAATTNQMFVPQPVSGSVTVQVIGVNQAAATNSYTVTLIYQR